MVSAPLRLLQGFTHHPGQQDGREKQLCVEQTWHLHVRGWRSARLCLTGGLKGRKGGLHIASISDYDPAKDKVFLLAVAFRQSHSAVLYS